MGIRDFLILASCCALLSACGSGANTVTEKEASTELANAAATDADPSNSDQPNSEQSDSDQVPDLANAHSSTDPLNFASQSQPAQEPPKELLATEPAEPDDTATDTTAPVDSLTSSPTQSPDLTGEQSGELSGTATEDSVMSSGDPANSVDEGPADSTPTITDQPETDTTVAVTNAMQRGSVSTLTPTQLLDYTATQLEQDLSNCNTELIRFYSNTVEQLAFPFVSNYVYSNRRTNYPLIVDQSNGATYGWIGQPADAPRHAYFGSGIFNLDGGEYYGNLGNEAKLTLFNVISWLLGHTERSLPISEAPLTIVAQSQYVAQRVSTWISHHIAEPVWTVTADTALIHSGQADLYIGITDNGKPLLEQAQAAGVPVLIWSEAFDPGDTVQPLGLSWHWWGPTMTGGFNSAYDQCQFAYPLADFKTLTEALLNNELDFDYSDTACTTPLYTTQCNTSEVIHSSGNTLQQLIFDSLENIKFQLERLDFEDTSVFDLNEDYDHLKLAVLTGDAFRQLVSYPLDKSSSAPLSFFGALYADYSQHNARESQYAQTNSGDFNQPNISNGNEDTATTAAQIITLNSSSKTDWTATGLTAPAGATVTIERQDSSPVTVSARINMIRHHSTWEWNTDGFTRPKFVSSHIVQIGDEDATSISSPVGGPLYVQTGSETPGSEIRLRITGAQPHPTLKSSDGQAISSFVTELNRREYSWIDVVTPFVEVHSRLSLIEEAFNQQDGDSGNGYTVDDIRKWAQDLDSWLIKTNLTLAGIQDSTLPDLNTGVIEICNRLLLDCQNPTLHVGPAKQHINADLRASCGDLCSGNPFDQNSSVNPAGFGESHEMGHNLQRYRFNVYGARSNESSNNIFPYHVAFSIAETGDQATQSTTVWPDSQSTYEQLQESLNYRSEAGEGHPIWSQAGIYDNVVTRTQFYLQLAFIHDTWLYNPSNKTDGWDIYTLLYLLEREFDEAVNSTDVQWLNKRDSLGFSNYDRTNARSISGADFLAVALSHISQRSHANYFATWGILISPAALQQIDSAGYTNSVPLVFWRTPESGVIDATLPSRNVANARSLDGVSEWY